MPVTVGQTRWQFLCQFPLGSTAKGGGNTICKNGGIFWIVAPSSSEVSRDWSNRNDAVTLASLCTTATGWFIPDVSQLQNPGYTCSTYWDSYTPTPGYWTITSGDPPNPAAPACVVRFSDGATFNGIKSNSFSVRAFRCVTY